MIESGKSGGLRGSQEHSKNWHFHPGVTAGNWDYFRSRQVADQYDIFVQNDPLTQLDWRYISNYLPTSQPNLVVADFGTGTGRHAVSLLLHGCRCVLGIDLSRAMLLEAIRKVEEKKPHFRSEQSFIPMLGNLVALEGMESDSVDFGICMFSTLGMIKGRDNRQLFLKHVYRILKPGSRFIVHVHNYWYQCRYPGGLKWMLGNGLMSLLGRSQIGDRQADYRSIRNMFLHSFRYSEFRKELNESGFRLIDTHRLMAGNNQPSQGYRFNDCFRTIGWLVVCDRPLTNHPSCD
ncbi:MAG: methyltransferase domain-containing protein [Mariniblastus sp.]|nr:methyltransferase domain-containing protein [Mariniblastus sp.]